ncbi:hypothetical protein EON65_14540 [archaeon]|nr:MAG: hypothetical protein EON65_14540 [archaeon]
MHKSPKCFEKLHVDGYPFGIFPDDPCIKELESSVGPSLSTVSNTTIIEAQRYCNFCNSLVKLPGCRNFGHVDGRYYSRALQYSSNLCSFCNSLVKLPNCKIIKHVDGCATNFDPDNFGSALGPSKFDRRINGYNPVDTTRENAAEKIAETGLPKSVDERYKPVPRESELDKGGGSGLKQKLESIASGLIGSRDSPRVSTALSVASATTPSTHTVGEGSALKSRFAEGPKEEELDNQLAEDTFLTSISGYVQAETTGGILRKAADSAQGKTKKLVQWADCATGAGSGKLSSRYVYNNTFSP